MTRRMDAAAEPQPATPVIEARGVNKSFRRGSEEIHALADV